MLHVPYAADGQPTKNMREYIVKQLKEEVIPVLEKVSGVTFDIDRLREYLRKSAIAENDLVWMLESSKHAVARRLLFRGVYYMGPIFTAFRGPTRRSSITGCFAEIEERIAKGLCAQSPDGDMPEENYRLVVEGPPNWTSFRDFWRMFSEAGAVVVASSYTKVGGVYDYDGFRHDPDHPLETLADYCLGVYTNRNLPTRVDMLARNIVDYDADGLLINSIKSSQQLSAGQLVMMREIEKITGKPGAFIETDLVDPRYFSAANVKNRLESHFQMIDQKRRAGGSAAAAGA